MLKDDGYEEVDAGEYRPGDLIVYFGETGDIEHSGIVVEFAPDDLRLKIPRVLSKWGVGSEWVHPANDCPYSFANVKYYRVSHHDRP